MQLTMKKRVEVPVDTLRMNLAVRYDEEDMPNDFPCRRGDMWRVDIDLATGKIKDWPGPAFTLYMKVCDEGVYTLLADGKKVAEIDGYVPHGVVPGDYGDYVSLDVDADGTIKNWPDPEDLDFGAFEGDK